MYIHAVAVECCHFCFAIAKVLRIPKAKKLLRLFFTNAAKGFFNHKTMISLLKFPYFVSFYSFTFYSFTFKRPFYFFTLLLFYFYSYLCSKFQNTQYERKTSRHSMWRRRSRILRH